MKKTKKALLLAACAVLLVAASVMGTMAYLTSKAEVKNTFTVGNVKIDLDEARVDQMGKPIEGEKRVKSNEYKLLPAHTYTKDPTVTVLKDSEDCYVRLKVTFNNASEIIALCTDPEFEEDGPTGVENAYPLIRMVKFVEANAAKWDGIIPDNMVDTEEMLADAKYFAYDKATDTLTYYFYYTGGMDGDGIVPANTDDTVLPVLFDTITVPEWVTGDQLATLDKFEINVVAEAIQADGFEADTEEGLSAADAAWKSFN